MLIHALRDFGVPTWQDVGNLHEEPTEDGLRAALEDAMLSSGVLWITPEVKGSTVIRTLEAPKLLDRVRNRDGFFVVPVCAGGLAYADAGIVVDARFSLEDLPHWNVRRLNGAPHSRPHDHGLELAGAAAVASRVLQRRIAAIHASLPAEEPLLLRGCSRTPAGRSCDVDLAVDWQHRFNGRHAMMDAWDGHILPALKSVSNAMLAEAAGRGVICDGLIPLAGAAALGASMLQPLGIKAAWRQHIEGGTAQLWSLNVREEDVRLQATDVGGAFEATDIAVLVSINQNAEEGFGASRGELPAFRAVLHVHAPDKKPMHFRTPGEALSAARQIVAAIKNTRDKYRYSGTTHLFFCGPAGVAFLVGQLCNQLMPLQTYEYDREHRGGIYVPAALIRRVEPILPI